VVTKRVPGQAGPTSVVDTDCWCRQPTCALVVAWLPTTAALDNLVLAIEAPTCCIVALAQRVTEAAGQAQRKLRSPSVHVQPPINGPAVGGIEEMLRRHQFSYPALLARAGCTRSTHSSPGRDGRPGFIQTGRETTLVSCRVRVHPVHDEECCRA
jgi:hypothetical protein